VREWLEQACLGPIYITPVSPWENGHEERLSPAVSTSFRLHVSLRAELLDRELFFDYGESQSLLEDWRETYNGKRPHGALGYRSPRQAAREASAAPCPLRGPLAVLGTGCAAASLAARKPI
jgi:transposase InsO family protein